MALETALPTHDKDDIILKGAAKKRLKETTEEAKSSHGDAIK